MNEPTKEFTHGFTSLSDAKEFCDRYGAHHHGDGFVSFTVQGEESIKFWEAMEEGGPFPCDCFDDR